MKSRGEIYKHERNYIAVKTDSMKWKVGDIITITKGTKRSIPQNKRYWKLLNWLIENGLKELGHFCPYALHMNLKQYFIAEKVFTKGQFKAIEEATTTTLDKKEFSEYMDKVQDTIGEKFGIDTSGFDVNKKESS